MMGARGEDFTHTDTSYSGQMGDVSCSKTQRQKMNLLAGKAGNYRVLHHSINGSQNG